MRSAVRTLLVLLAVSLTTDLNARVSRGQDQAARALISAAIDAMGGRARLDALRTVRTESIGHERHLEQSERPEGPWMTSYHQRVELRDVAGSRIRREFQTRNWSRADWPPSPSIVVADGEVAARRLGDRWVRGSLREAAELGEQLALAPDRLLLTAERAKDLKVAPGRTLQGSEHEGVTFTWNEQTITLFLNRHTHLPTMLEVVKADAGGPWGPPIWGDVTERHWFGWWDLQKGIQFPRQVTTEWNGFPLREFSVLKLAIDEPLDASLFDIPEEARQSFLQMAKAAPAPAGRIDEAQIRQVHPLVTQIPTGYNVHVVQQPDGLVVLEATTSSEFTRRVLALIEKRFPGVPIKALVTTSDAWPHLGGVREYIARKIPVYALDLNLPILKRLVEAPWTRSRDTLAERPAAPIWRSVSSRTTIGTGESRVELIPVRGEIGERMMIAALPGLDLAYTSDLVQRSSRTPGGFFLPGTLVEVISAIERERLTAPARIVGMHLAPTPWSDIVAAAAAAQAH